MRLIPVELHTKPCKLKVSVSICTKRQGLPHQFSDVSTSRNPIRGKYTFYLTKIGKLVLGCLELLHVKTPRRTVNGSEE